jgi:polyhydroxybutyrate depolymerase
MTNHKSKWPYLSARARAYLMALIVCGLGSPALAQTSKSQTQARAQAQPRARAPLLAQNQASSGTQYVFVPGSRQARAVPTQASQPGYGRSYYAQPGQTAAPARSGGMQLHTSGSTPVYRQPLSPATTPTAGSFRSRPTVNSTVSPAVNSAINSAIRPAAGGKAFDFVDSISVDGVARSYRVHIPASYDRSKPTPVVLAFHGLQMNALTMMGMSGLNGLSDRKGFIVVYGEGLNNRWNDGTAGGSTSDDIGYVQTMLQKLPRLANIDAKRVYACGISNGGFFVQRLACAMADKIAAVGVVASSMTSSTPGLMSSARPVPIVFFLGSEDPLLPWGDGRTKGLGNLGEALGLSGIGSIDSPAARIGGLLPVPEMIGFWTSHNNCSSSPNTVQMPDSNPRDGTKVKRETYGSGDVVLYVIEGGGHTWPGALQLNSLTELCGATSQDIDASELMWDFFQRRAR